ncbi:DUF6193 family natural product biosynthesis protein [Streptomyces sp. NPDC059851]|uniref:DUF6193 family natural product biosynthesis protein n=1 Tax=Streptomyces sp. NPDC059851 TaxID=3346971 RepID=UPI0036481441
MHATDATPGGHGPLPPRPALPDVAGARHRGAAAAVGARWEAVTLAWKWYSDCAALRGPGGRYPGIAPLLEAVRAEPLLRRLYPVTSHFTLSFSSCTQHPFVLALTSLTPLSGGLFQIRSRATGTVTGIVDSAHRAAALAVADLPAGFGPAVAGPGDRARQC